jgi:Uma2 family endonuclease
MSAVVVPAAPQTGRPPQPHKWTVTEFNHMGDMGWFEGRGAFLLDGVILENGPMKLPHTVALGLVEQAVRAAFGPGWWLRGQSPLHVDQHDDPFPDFAVVRGSPRDHLGRQPTTADLVVEIADSSLAVDTTEKAERYATAGVADYWVLDLENRRLLVFRDPAPLPKGLGATAYRTQLVLGPADRASPLAAPAASVLVGDLLP